MARKSRIEFAGAVYHVINRGSRHEVIFREDADREMFLSTLGETCARTGWRVHAYVLMGNHFHLLLETPQGLLSRGMHWLQTTYTNRFNRRHKLSGHVFQGRFKASVIDPEEGGHFATVADYIHLNPLRAGLVDLRHEDLSAYPWSSLTQYGVGARARCSWLLVERVLGERGYSDCASHRRLYKGDLAMRSLGEQELNEQWERIRRGWYLGSEEFRDRLLEKLESIEVRRKVKAGAVQMGSDHAQWEAERIARGGLKHFALRDDQLIKLPKSDRRKVIIAALIKAHTSVTLDWISKRLRMGADSHVSRLSSRTATRADRACAKQIMSRIKT